MLLLTFCAIFCFDSLQEIESSCSNERLSLSYSRPSCGKSGWIRWATPIWLTGPRWGHVSQTDGGNHFLAGNHSAGKKAFTFIALGSLRLPLWPLHRFYSADYKMEPAAAGEYISGGYLTDPLYLSRLKGLLGIIIQSEISKS